MRNELSREDRALLEAVSRAAFANPFSEDRLRLDQAIGGPAAAGAAPEGCLEAALARVRRYLSETDAQGHKALDSFQEADRPLVLSTYLFDAFHRCAPDFDRLIQRQIEAGDQPCAVPFARGVLDGLAQRGVAQADAARCFAMFFQLRRAFYFIDRTLVGESAAMRQLRIALWNNVFTHDTRLYERHLWDRMEDFSTLLLGETGTGKGAAAAAIGRSGFIPFDPERRCFTESFVRTFTAINLSQFPEALIESELFGHRKGAFTGAVEAHEGILARCSPHGAIFLDEIGEISIPVQIKLLQVLQDRVFSPVGSHEKRRFSGRVIAATNKSLDELRQQGKFRDDFYYRLCSDVIVVPPLRQRLAEDPAELEVLLGQIVARIAGPAAGELTGFVRDAIRQSPGEGYGWAGNVRELEQCVRRILLARSYAGDRGAVSRDRLAALCNGIRGGSLSAQELLQSYCALLYQRHGSYEDVARRTGLDRRTVKKHVVREAGE
jgi:DNA-binding NtrC family response regulator